MKIFIIARGYPSKKDPIWGCFEKDQAEALRNLGHQVTILSVDTRFRFFKRTFGLQHFVDNNIAVYNMFIIPSLLLFFLPEKIKAKFYSWLLLLTFKNAIQNQGIPDILYAHYLDIMNWTIMLKKTYNIPIVGIEHWSALNIRPIPNRIRHLVANTYPFVDRLIAVSTPLKQSILDFKISISRPISIVHNMVGKEFSFLPLQKNSHPLTFISTGRLVYGKGYDLFITALHNIEDKLPKDWIAIIIGGGKLKDKLQKQINAFNLQNHIYLVGTKNKTEIVHLLQHSDIFVFPSRGENFSVAILEALACGLPVIASICGGVRECINEKNGLLFPVDDSAKLAQAILRMVQNIDNYNREAIAEDCQAHFSPEVIATQLTQIFEDTIKNKS